ncbi:MAG: hypothetical protein IPN76_18665 [Saprospiraceae bacterium]|nr:hypothetical protein [Saprospiraceae bacterium]
MIANNFIQPRIVIVEDNVKISRAIKRNLNVVNRTNGHCLLPDYELVNSAEDFKSLMEKTQKADSYFSSVIVDINLGNDEPLGGLDILEFIQKNYPDSIHAFVYSAYPNYREKCVELGVDKDSFMVKHSGTMDQDIVTIRQKIERKFLSKIKTGALSKFDLLILKSTSKLNFNYAYIPLSDGDFNELGASERMLLFQFLSQRIKPGLNIFSQNDRLWQYKVTENWNVRKASPVIVQNINPDTGLVEGLQIRTKSRSLYIGLGDLETLEKSQDTLFGYAAKGDDFENRLAEFFFVKRLLDLYEVKENRKAIVNIAKKYTIKKNQLAFLFGVWEFIARNKQQEEKGGHWPQRFFGDLQ